MCSKKLWTVSFNGVVLQVKVMELLGHFSGFRDLLDLIFGKVEVGYLLHVVDLEVERLDLVTLKIHFLHPGHGGEELRYLGNLIVFEHDVLECLTLLEAGRNLLKKIVIQLQPSQLLKFSKVLWNLFDLVVAQDDSFQVFGLD